MNRWGANLLALAGALLFLTGCTAAPSGSTSPLTLPVVEVQPEPAQSDGQEGSHPVASVSVTGLPGDLLNSVLADASQRTGVALDALIVTQAEATTWNDGSLGCPEPGMFYTQALVDGYWIIVEAEGQSLDYRVQSNGMLRVCEGGLRRGGARP